MLWVIKRLVFYGVLIFLGGYASTKLQLSVEGKNAVMFFLAFSVISGALQSINIWLLRKITDFDKLQNLGHWARERLKDRLLIRREAAFSRAAVGLTLAIFIGLASAYMKYLDSGLVPNWILGGAVAMILISLFLLFFALYEFYIVTRLESDLLRQANKNEAKEKALTSIRDDSENKS